MGVDTNMTHVDALVFVWERFSLFRIMEDHKRPPGGEIWKKSFFLLWINSVSKYDLMLIQKHSKISQNTLFPHTLQYIMIKSRLEKWLKPLFTSASVNRSATGPQSEASYFRNLHKCTNKMVCHFLGKKFILRYIPPVDYNPWLQIIIQESFSNWTCCQIYFHFSQFYLHWLVYY